MLMTALRFMRTGICMSHFDFRPLGCFQSDHMLDRVHRNNPAHDVLLLFQELAQNHLQALLRHVQYIVGNLLSLSVRITHPHV